MLLAKKKKPPYFIQKKLFKHKTFLFWSERSFLIVWKSDKFLKCDEIQNNLWLSLSVTRNELMDNVDIRQS